MLILSNLLKNPVSGNMYSENVQQALQAATDTDALIVESGAIKKIAEIVHTYFPEATVVIIADANTWEVAGEAVHNQLQAADVPVLEPFIFPGYPMLHADYEHIEDLREFLKGTSAIPIAVGSGTINDLVKTAAFESERRYMVVATAASMDGYSSYGSAVQVKGFKQTLNGRAPFVIVADSDILRNAPAAMTAAGYGDLASKIPAGADWIIADALGAQAIEPSIWDMVQTDLRKWLSVPEKLQPGDAQAFEWLFEGLTMTGFAMQAMHNTRPASGADHMFSHIWEMQDLQDADGLPVSHGFKVSLGTLASTALMETIFSKAITDVDIDGRCARWKCWEEREAEICAAFPDMPQVRDRMLAESQAKYLTTEQLRDRLRLLTTIWEELAHKVREQLYSYPELRAKLVAADCPVAPEQIYLSRECMHATFFQAQMMRNRYTILDLAYELGWLEECVEEIMESETYLR